MKNLFLLCCLVALAGFGFAQTPVKIGPQPFTWKNSVQVDLFGHGGAYSVNYERVQLNGARFKTVLRAGAALYPAWELDHGIRFKIPVTLNEVFTIYGGHHAEVGAGFLFTNFYNFPTSPFGFRYQGVEEFAAFHVGYRYQHPDCRVLFKAAFTPVVGTFHAEFGAGFYPTGGLTVGYAF